MFKWCRDFAARGVRYLEEDPLLAGFDLFVIHLDADVADRSYQDGGGPVVDAATGLPALPCGRPCPPADASVDELRERVVAWLGLERLGARTILCIPSKAIEAWLAAGSLQASHTLLQGIECRPDLEAQLAALPKGARIKKSKRSYHSTRES